MQDDGGRRRSGCLEAGEFGERGVDHKVNICTELYNVAIII